MKTKNGVFSGFAEFYHLTRVLSKEQRETIFNSLTNSEKKDLKSSYQKGGWSDLFFRDMLDAFAKNIYSEYGFDILSSRCKALCGKTVYLDRFLWKYIISYLSQFDAKHTYYLIGGIYAVPEGENAVLLLPSKIN